MIREELDSHQIEQLDLLDDEVMKFLNEFSPVKLVYAEEVDGCVTVDGYHTAIIKDALCEVLVDQLGVVSLMELYPYVDEEYDTQV
jgi:hypothetical protein